MIEIGKTTETIHCFIDEGGDSTFYGTRKKLLVGEEGFQPMLNLGMITLENKVEIRKAIVNFMNDLKNDPLYSSIHSLKQDNWYLHARGDHPEVRAKFFEFLRKLEGFKCFIVMGRKRLKTFQKKHNSNESEFYFDLVYHLLKDRLNDESKLYHIFLSSRQKSTQVHLEAAITKAIARDNQLRKVKKDIQFKFDIVRSQDTPELSVVDYMLWALQRYIFMKEERFFKALQEKFNLIIDLYDIDNYGNNYYSKKNIFDINKASEFKNDGYI